MRLRITYTNWPTVRSAGTRYFFLSMVAMSDFSTFSQITCEWKLALTEGNDDLVLLPDEQISRAKLSKRQR